MLCAPLGRWRGGLHTHIHTHSTQHPSVVAERGWDIQVGGGGNERIRERKRSDWADWDMKARECGQTRTFHWLAVWEERTSVLPSWAQQEHVGVPGREKSVLVR